MSDTPPVDAGINQSEVQAPAPKSPSVPQASSQPGPAEKGIIANVVSEQDPTKALKKIAGVTEPPVKDGEMTREEKHAIEEAQAKRFVLSKEQFAKDRIDGIKDTVDQLQQEHPEILGLTLYGSTVKGTSTEASDIDGFLVVDAEKILDSQGQEMTKEEISDQYGIKSTNVLFQELTQTKYEELVRDKLKDSLGLADEQVKHIRVRPISRKIIDDRLVELNKWAVEMQAYDKQKAEYFAALDRKEFDKVRPSLPDSVSPTYNLEGMFHLKVGRGIETYRSYLIDKLSGMGGNGERIWGEIIESVERLERNMHSGTQIRYPRTLEEARKVYSTPKTQPQVPINS